MLMKCLILILAFMVNRYTFIFEIACRDCSGKILPHEYRKKNGMTIKDARTYARRVSSMANVFAVKFYKEMY